MWIRNTPPLLESIKKTIARLRSLRQPITLSDTHLHEQFTKSSGPGGQNVNKRDTCVRLVHLPTGISVRAADSRHQEINRREARRLLREKLDEHVNGECCEKRLKELAEREKKRKKYGKAKKKYGKRVEEAAEDGKSVVSL
jgi:protein subunit release factor B